MKTACLILFLFTTYFLQAQQYYLRGEVRDEAGNALQNVVILQPSTGYVYRTGTYGDFGITTHRQPDTLEFSFSGYKTERLALSADHFLSIRLKLLPANASNVRRDKLASLTKDLARDEQRKWFAGEETYASLIENHFVEAQRFPSTGVSLNVDMASYSNIRRFITLKSIVPPDAVRIEEMLNYFNLDYEQPAGNEVFHARTALTDCPWAPGHQLYYVNLFSKKLDLDTLPASNLIFLIDISGSMDMANRLPLLKSAFRLLVSNLRAKDSVAIVAYGGTTGVMLNTTSGAEKDKIIKAIDDLEPGGATPGESGIKLAYSVARNHFINGGNNRVILATDGDFNVGMRSESDLDELISQQRESGIYLTCLGVGMGNYKDSKIQTLARKGNGNFAYLDNFQEAEKVLMKEFTQTLYSVADNVYMNVSFNPQYVDQYRLIGFDNKVGAMRDTLSAIEGGEIGSGRSTLAVFELVPTQANLKAITKTSSSNQLATVNIQYQLPNDTAMKNASYHFPVNYQSFNNVARGYRFYTAVVMFGSLLRSSQYVGENEWDNLKALAASSAEPGDPLQEEFSTLVQQAHLLYSKTKKRR